MIIIIILWPHLDLSNLESHSRNVFTLIFAFTIDSPFHVVLNHQNLQTDSFLFKQSNFVFTKYISWINKTVPTITYSVHYNNVRIYCEQQKWQLKLFTDIRKLYDVYLELILLTWLCMWRGILIINYIIFNCVRRWLWGRHQIKWHRRNRSLFARSPCLCSKMIAIMIEKNIFLVPYKVSFSRLTICKPKMSDQWDFSETSCYIIESSSLFRTVPWISFWPINWHW